MPASAIAWLLFACPLGTAQGSANEATERRAAATLVDVDLRFVEVHEAFRILLRRGGFGGTVAPDVQGTVTVTLRNVPFEAAVQNLARQVEASYRIDHGFFEIVRRPDEGPASPPPLRLEPVAAEPYRQIAGSVVRGDGPGLRGLLAPGFEMRNAAVTLRGERAARALAAAFRANPGYRFERWNATGKMRSGCEQVVAQFRPDAPPVYFRDLWSILPDGSWRLDSREETAPAYGRRYTEATLSRLLDVAAQTSGVAYTVDPAARPALQRRVSVDLRNVPFETLLQTLVHEAELTYTLEAGIYRIVPRERKGDWVVETIPVIEFEKADVRVALSWLFQRARAPFKIDPRVKGFVNVSLRNVTLDVAVSNLVRQADAKFRVDKGTYSVEPGKMEMIPDILRR